MRLACGAAVIALLLCGVPGAQAQSRAQASADALQRWVAAVREHAPGRPDAVAGVIAGLSYADRVQLNPAMQLFLKAVRAQPIATKTEAERQIAGLFHSVQEHPGVAAFVRRAAILHTDAAIFADHFPDPPDDAPAPPPPPATNPRGALSGRGVDPPPLLYNERYVLHTDGRVTGEAPANWNWPFARSLLDLLLASAEARPRKGPCRGADCAGTLRASGIAAPADLVFVADWYHGVASYLLAAGDHGDLRSHLERAAELLPRDARILFDRACYAETLGLAYNQALHDDPAIWHASQHMVVDLPGEERTDQEAEKLFRESLDVDPAYAEARVRHARLLERSARHDEAAAELDEALASTADPPVEFYAHLFAGRVAQSLGRIDRSVEQYSAAIALYPDAQSALLGASQAAVIAADVPRALSFVRRLGPRSGTPEADPWRIYHIGAGRDMDALMAALWARVTR